MGAFFGTIFGAFLFGTVGFYIVAALFIIWGFYLMEKESLFGIVVSMILFFLFMQFLAKYNIVASVAYNPWRLLWIPGYFAVGFGWSFIKWWLYVNKAADKFRDMKDKFLEQHGKEYDSNKIYSQQTSSATGCNLKEEWDRYIQFKGEAKPPLAKMNKGRITSWIIYWPFSFLWSLLNDIIKKIVRQLVTTFQKVYQFISDRAFKGLEDVK